MMVTYSTIIDPDDWRPLIYIIRVDGIEIHWLTIIPDQCWYGIDWYTIDIIPEENWWPIPVNIVDCPTIMTTIPGTLIRWYSGDYDIDRRILFVMTWRVLIFCCWWHSPTVKPIRYRLSPLTVKGDPTMMIRYLLTFLMTRGSFGIRRPSAMLSPADPDEGWWLTLIVLFIRWHYSDFSIRCMDSVAHSMIVLTLTIVSLYLLAKLREKFHCIWLFAIHSSVRRFPVWWRPWLTHCIQWRRKPVTPDDCSGDHNWHWPMEAFYSIRLNVRPSVLMLFWPVIRWSHCWRYCWFGDDPDTICYIPGA